MDSPLLIAELYEYCVKEKIADANLIAKWKKQVSRVLTPNYGC
jgi:hypothetical protein